jgi:Icc-related predicted phosphoesterase
MDLKLPLGQALGKVCTDTHVWWIPGNHDADRVEWYDNLFESTLADRNLHGRVVEVAGVRIAGLGGIFREEIWHPDTGIQYATRQKFMQAKRSDGKWRDGVTRKHRVSIWWEDYEKLFGQRADVLVTHEAPSCHKHGFKELDELAQAMKVHTVVHGHHHVRYSSTIVNGGIQVHGVGQGGVSDLNGNVIVPGPNDYRYQAWQRQL